MGEFISRDSVLEQITELPSMGCATYDADSVENIIRFEPAANVVEVEELIAKIEREIEDKNTSSSLYVCEDGTKIHTDVGYVHDWFKYYADVLRRWAKGGRSDGEI